MELLGIVSIPDWLAFVAIGLVTLYIYLTWNFGVLERQGLKTVRPIPLFGNTLKRFTMCFHDADTEDYRKLGKLQGLYEGRQPSIMTGDVEWIKAVLVKQFNNFTDRRIFELNEESKIIEKFLSGMRGEEWRQTRPLLSPAFTSGKLKQMAGLMAQSAEGLCERLQKIVRENGDKGFEVKAVLNTYAVDVIASCAFGCKINVDDSNDPFFVNARALLNQDVSIKAPLLLLAPKLANALGLELFPSSAIKFFRNLGLEVINQRKKTGNRRPDFLQLLLDAQKEEESGKPLENGVNGNVEISSNGHPPSSSKRVLTEEIIVAQCMLFFLAGFDNVASAVAMMLRSLAFNKDCQEKLIQEIDGCVAKEGKLTTDAIMQMEYLDMIFSETLRLFPPAARLERVCTSDCTVEGIHIKKGMLVAIPVYAIHHDEEFYPDPEKFDPERFSSSNKAGRNPYTYLVFGAGPRNCIGMRFAMLQAKIALAHIMANFTVSICANTENPIIYRKGFPMLIPINGISLKFSSRNLRIS